MSTVRGSRNILQLENVSKRYRNEFALDDVSLSVGEAEVVTLVGHNGAGKSTTLKILAGLIEPTSGSFIDKTDSDSLSSSIGYLPESPDLDPEKTGKEYLHLIANLQGVPQDEIDGLIDTYSSNFNMNNLSKSISDMSKGMVQKVALIETVIHDPNVLLYDEPTSGLDPQTREEVLQFIKQQSKNGRSVVLSTHDINGAESVTDTFYRIKNGSVVKTVSTDNNIHKYILKYRGNRKLKTRVVDSMREVQTLIEDIATDDGKNLIEIKQDIRNTLGIERGER